WVDGLQPGILQDITLVDGVDGLQPGPLQDITLVEGVDGLQPGVDGLQPGPLQDKTLVERVDGLQPGTLQDETLVDGVDGLQPGPLQDITLVEGVVGQQPVLHNDQMQVDLQGKLDNAGKRVVNEVVNQQLVSLLPEDRAKRVTDMLVDEVDGDDYQSGTLQHVVHQELAGVQGKSIMGSLDSSVSTESGNTKGKRWMEYLQRNSRNGDEEAAHRILDDLLMDIEKFKKIELESYIDIKNSNHLKEWIEILKKEKDERTNKWRNNVIELFELEEKEPTKTKEIASLVEKILNSRMGVGMLRIMAKRWVTGKRKSAKKHVEYLVQTSNQKKWISSEELKDKGYTKDSVNYNQEKSNVSQATKDIVKECLQDKYKDQVVTSLLVLSDKCGGVLLEKLFQVLDKDPEVYIPS
ncbi:hypothetical protein DLAC_08386, partial [Tieghemostelium lacteum]